MAPRKQAAISFVAAFLLADLKNAIHPGGGGVGAELAQETTDSTIYSSGVEPSDDTDRAQEETQLPDSTLREAPLLEGLRPVDYEDEDAIADHFSAHGHSSQKGSGEKYGKLLSKGSDFTHLPETHPARMHADSKALHRRSFHLMLAGIVLATAYLGFYCYQTSGSGLRTHEERHSFALSRMSSPSSAFLWVAAWRLWLGFLISGLVSIALNAYRLEKAFNRRKRILPMWVVEHWEILVGLPLLATVMLSGRATQLATLESGAAPAAAGGLLGKVLANSGASYQSFLFDAFFQIPFGLVVVGIGGLLAAITGKMRQRFRKTEGKKRITPSSRSMSSDADETPRHTSDSAFDVDSRDPTESRTHGSITQRKKLRKEGSTRRRRKLLFDELPEQDEMVRSHSSTSTRRVARRRTAPSRRYSAIPSAVPPTGEAGDTAVRDDDERMAGLGTE